MKLTIARSFLIAAVLSVALGAAELAGPLSATVPSAVTQVLAQGAPPPPAGEPAPAAAQSQQQPPPPKKKSLVDYYFDGGVLMHPILLCSIVMTALIIELFIRLRLVKVAPPAVVQQLRSLFQAQNYQEAWRVCATTRSFLTNVLMPALERFGRGREAVERVLMDHGIKEASALRTRVLYLSVVAVIAPMLGLLGTVQGMIMAFEVVSLGGLGDPGKLAASIGVALITTFAGLVVGIPSMFFFYFFRNQMTKVTTQVEDICNELLEDVPFEELQGVKIGTAMEGELHGTAAPARRQPAVVPAVMPAATVPPQPSAAPAVLVPGTTQGKKVSMVNCPNCQALILSGIKQCPNCKVELDWG